MHACVYANTNRRCMDGSIDASICRCNSTQIQNAKMHREVYHARKVLPFPELEPLDVLTDILPHQYRILWQIFSQRLRACVLACVSALASVRPCLCLHTCMHTCVRTHARIRRNCIRVCMQGYTHAAHLAYMHACTHHTHIGDRETERETRRHTRTHTHTHTHMHMYMDMDMDMDMDVGCVDLPPART